MSKGSKMGAIWIFSDPEEGHAGIRRGETLVSTLRGEGLRVLYGFLCTFWVLRVSHFQGS